MLVPPFVTPMETRSAMLATGNIAIRDQDADALHLLAWNHFRWYSGPRSLGPLAPLIKVLSRSEDLIDMLFRPKAQPLHLIDQRAS
jgi:hypothetical protein